MPDTLNYSVKSDSPVNTQTLSAPPPSAPAETVNTATAATATPSVNHTEDVQKVSHDLKRLLSGPVQSRLKPEVRAHIEALDAWTDAYMGGLDAAKKISNHALGTLTEAQKELSLALEEFLRLEDEGGNVATPEQQSHTDELSKALRRINGLIPVVETTFAGPNDPANPEVEPGNLPGTDAPEVNPVPAPEGNPDVLPDIPPVDRPEIKI